MGLLRKAAGAASVGDTNVSALPAALSSLAEERPKSRAASGPSARLGLLKRSIRALAAAPAKRSAEAAVQLSRHPSAESSSESQLARDLVEESKALSDGVELPSLIFATLRKRLSLVKSALLLYDPVRLEYAPWASHGFDQTTLHRMRIPLGANETFNALANGDPLDLSNPEQRAAFQRFFSSREFALLERLILCPYIFEDTLVGVLLITEAHHPFASTAAFLSCLKDIAADVASLLQMSRGFLTKLSQARATHPPATPEEQVRRLLESGRTRGKKMLLLSLNLGAYIREVASGYPDLDLFRLREDVRSLLDAFLADLGVAIMLPAGSLLVCLQSAGRDDIPLFLHQLRYFLSSRFAAAPAQGNSSSIDVLKSRIWPDEGTDIRELISFLSS